MTDKIEYADLNAEVQHRLLTASANLLREITEVWGAEQGMLLWEKVAEGLGQDLKGALFFSMITGDFSGDVTIAKINEKMAVPILKSIRWATGLGLKDAKDIYDHVRDVGPKSIPVKYENRATVVKELRDHGCVVR